MRFIKYLSIFILLAVQYSFQESSSENSLSLETLPSTEKSLSSEGGSSSEDVLMQNDGESRTNSQEESPLGNAEETKELMESVDPNTDNEGDNNVKNNFSDGLPLVNSMEPNVEESMEENGSNLDVEADSNEEENLADESTSEIPDVPEVNEVSEEPMSDSSNDNDINEGTDSYGFEPVIDSGFIVDRANLLDPSQIQTSIEVPETRTVSNIPVLDSKKTVDLSANNGVSKNRITKGLKSLGNKFGSVFGSVKNKAKNVFKSSRSGLNSFFKNSKSKLKNSSKNLKNRLSGFFHKKQSKKLVSNGADKREKRSVLAQSVKELGKDITKGFKKAVSATKKLLKN